MDASIAVHREAGLNVPRRRPHRARCGAVTKSPHHQTGNADTRARRPGLPTTPSGRQADAITHAHLTTTRPYQLAPTTLKLLLTKT
jgi:hypothetical protein